MVTQEKQNRLKELFEHNCKEFTDQLKGMGVKKKLMDDLTAGFRDGWRSGCAAALAVVTAEES